MSAGFAKADAIAQAVLYEGYMLYPYRASSTKNRRRCGLGTLYPEQHQDVVSGVERCGNQTQCLVAGTPSTTVAVCVRFLQMRSRVVEASVPGVEDGFQPVETLVVGNEVHRTWDEAVERTVEGEVEIATILNHPRTIYFDYAPSFESSDVRNPGGELAGRIRKAQLAVAGRIRISADQPGSALFRLTVEVVNATPYAQYSDRAAALLSAFISAHTILRVSDGEFVSLLDPPENLREAAATCKNLGVYPVLVGAPGERDVVLSSPIILYDYPQVAPESAGDFFDATEMDEMLTLRVMTLTEAEKSEMSGSDVRVRELLERTEATAREQLARTHGAVRSLRPIKDDAA